MLEEKRSFTIANTKIIEKLIEDENVAINHMILQKDDFLPEHYSNSNVYMIVIRGNITLRLDEQDEHCYPFGSIILIPFKTKMNVLNQEDEVAEIFVVKSPSPLKM